MAQDGANIFLSGWADIMDQSGASAKAAALPLDADADADAESSKFFIHVQERPPSSTSRPTIPENRSRAANARAVTDNALDL